jgi:hypothetical protein
MSVVDRMVSPLTLELLEWISLRPRTYPETIDAWRTNCPRHSVWDDAVSDGLVHAGRRVSLTTRGRTLLDARTTFASSRGSPPTSA